MSKILYYYPPVLEDLYIGFECEIQSSYGWQKGVWPDILRSDTLTGFALQEHGLIKATQQAGLRVQYLTKEQIEKEGWTPGLDEAQYKLMFGTEAWSLQKIIDHCVYKIHGIPDLKGALPLVTCHGIHCSNTSTNTEFHVFAGPIPSINEFRKICKWAGIK